MIWVGIPETKAASLSRVFSTQSTIIDPSRSPDQYPLSDMVCSLQGSRGGAGCPKTPQEPPPLTRPRCYVQPCLVSSNQSASIKTVSCTQVTPLSAAERMTSSLWRTTLSWANPDRTILSQVSLSHTFLHTHTPKPLKTQSQWTQTSSLAYCFNMCRRSRHCEKSYGSASIGCDEQRR